MQVSSKDQTLRVMALTRFHFVAGMPHAGARHLMMLLSQNPRFSAAEDNPAAKIYSELLEAISSQGSVLNQLDVGTQVALLRGSLDAAHHTRPMDAVVLDHNAAWLQHFESLAQVLPLSRFVVMVRDPAAIAATMAEETGAVQNPGTLLAPDGAIGRSVAQIECLMNSPVSDRLLLIDHDRLLSDPERVLAALYGVLREPYFEHDCRCLPEYKMPTPQLQGLRRRVSSLSKSVGRTSHRTSSPLWTRSSGTSATLLLRDAG